jgi:hypothetical protein
MKKTLQNLWKTDRRITGDIFSSSQIHINLQFYFLWDGVPKSRVMNAIKEGFQVLKHPRDKKSKESFVDYVFSSSIFLTSPPSSLLLWCGYQKQSLQDSSSAKANRPKIWEMIYLNPRVVIQFI